VDAIATRAAVFVPLFVLGFERAALTAYLVWVSFQATWIHANLRWRHGALERVLATPRFHHWHHAVEPCDRNFAVHLPAIDWLFGTLHLPAEGWPERYGLAGAAAPAGWLGQLVWPLRAGSRPASGRRPSP
jgi:lathosterol oxidase